MERFAFPHNPVSTSSLHNIPSSHGKSELKSSTSFSTNPWYSETHGASPTEPSRYESSQSEQDRTRGAAYHPRKSVAHIYQPPVGAP
ncbi:hypothetical protein K493DRAFT_75804 [Basidiobolus meristosporus CBS 931.73]|uniref:Uncharacterized protein n=1 Tax=Basidiobolus meristosporus CBS 931.73 TaxID=1314790 RepID=A0A1Y1XSI8_9FUNG|nr:hypothetical protein K493DRAFT_75804 [Basidiobolus meristosporus CBS 931.73]|eukprot:ORX88722.1 hypothetical protein K493DRAFT_75804 [Basidiobolus meristosporus CBS 931.73]